MYRRVAFLTAIAGVSALLAGCGLNFIGNFEQRAAWRADEESACMARRPVMASAYVQQVSAIRDNGACGIDYPLRLAAFQNGAVGVTPMPTIGCPMTEALESWMTESVQPAALAWFGEPVAEIKQISAYACRSRDNIRGEKLSEHAFGNALDVAAFVLTDGRKVTVKQGWRGEADEQAFLREVEATACQRFKTVLGPGEPYHGDHFHLDLAHHGREGLSHYCNPTPQVLPPIRAPYAGDRVANVSGAGQTLAAAPAAWPRKPAWPPKPAWGFQPRPLASTAWPWGVPPASAGGLSYAE